MLLLRRHLLPLHCAASSLPSPFYHRAWLLSASTSASTAPFSLEEYSTSLPPAASTQLKPERRLRRHSMKLPKVVTRRDSRSYAGPASNPPPTPTPSSPCSPASASPAPTSPKSSARTRCSSAARLRKSAPAFMLSVTASVCPLPRSLASSWSAHAPSATATSSQSSSSSSPSLVHLNSSSRSSRRIDKVNPGRMLRG
ncbi:hypothetical protein PVAP13_4NG130719 [Panicum virgatum]|uniref:Uncharacterized protein n=1 Tax=Panicum virgatum TaxID=38727 RepID=A0A8T0T7Y0_PANVG|nr:hypothetical protein PVAP13_4NG130719 [Panicum virgatum]